MEVAAVAEAVPRTPPEHLGVSGVAEPHHTDPMLQETPSKMEPWSLIKEMTYQRTPQSQEE